MAETEYSLNLTSLTVAGLAVIPGTLLFACGGNVTSVGQFLQVWGSSTSTLSSSTTLDNTFIVPVSSQAYRITFQATSPGAGTQWSLFYNGVNATHATTGTSTSGSFLLGFVISANPGDKLQIQATNANPSGPSTVCVYQT